MVHAKIILEMSKNKPAFREIYKKTCQKIQKTPKNCQKIKKRQKSPKKLPPGDSTLKTADRQKVSSNFVEKLRCKIAL